MIPKVKICGLKTLDDIRMVNQFPIDYVGFVFAPSKRQISIEEAKKMRELLRSDISAVGVFVNIIPKEVGRIVKECSLQIAQLHGEEQTEEYDEITVPIWKSISVRNRNSIEEAKKYTNAGGFVFDTYDKNAKGGTGKSFTWEWITEVSKKYYTILAGGLHAQNVQQAIWVASPHVIDVSSGVETDGKKDEAKVQEFIRKVKNCEYF